MKRWLDVLAVIFTLAAGSACSSTSETATNNGPRNDGDDAGSDAGASIEEFDDCTCAGVPDDPAPGDFGCPVPRTIMLRTCIVDASCGVYKIDFEQPATPVARHDIAIRYELAEPMPEKAAPTINDVGEDPGNGRPGGLELHGAKTWSPEEGPLGMQPDKRIGGKARVSGDRHALTVIPDRLEGPWVVEATFGFDKFYGPDVCGEGEGAGYAYTLRFQLP